MGECLPLKTLQEVLEWKEKDDWASYVEALEPRCEFGYHCAELVSTGASQLTKFCRTTGSKTLICHDMNGGYGDDRFVNGVNKYHEYFFSQWAITNIFVYFSHNLVTIPPLMWINSGHKHGVKILGTLITEYDNGKKIWEEIFSQERTLDVFTENLVRICKHYKFDGYLINIENEINPKNLNSLCRFLEVLKATLPASCTVIWYDAVSLVNGKLLWQNELNQHNKAAFLLCDGIFLNYGWKNKNLQISKCRGGSRQKDIYVGVDVFGRGCFGGGGYNCDRAVSIIKSYNLSVALFGVGWTYEVEAVTSNFFLAEQKMWSKLWPYFDISGPCNIPFKTTFCPGLGKNTFIKGDAVLTGPWFNLNLQDYQACSIWTSVESSGADGKDFGAINYCIEDGYEGGGCIIVKGNSDLYSYHVLLVSQFLCSRAAPLVLTVCSKWRSAYFPYHLILTLEMFAKTNTVVLEVKNPDKDISWKNEDYSEVIDVAETISQCVVQNNWIMSKFRLSFDGTIIAIRISTREDVLIGLFALENEEQGKHMIKNASNKCHSSH